MLFTVIFLRLNDSLNIPKDRNERMRALGDIIAIKKKVEI